MDGNRPNKYLIPLACVNRFLLFCFIDSKESPKGEFLAEADLAEVGRTSLRNATEVNDLGYSPKLAPIP